MEWNITDKAGIKKFQQKNIDRIIQVTRMAGIEAYSRISIKTPVKTGRARYSWFCSIGGIDFKTVPEGSYTFDPLRSAQAFATIKAGDTLYIANSLPYIEALNNGSSSQAPARFIETTISELQRDVDKIVRNIK